MPEIAEVARVVHFLKKHVVGKTIAAVKTQEDDIVYGKVGTSATAFKKAMTGKKILDARQQGKYFWLVMDSQPHPLMHLGMTGWIRFSQEDNAYYRPKKAEEPEWPPRFWKFVLEMKEDPDCKVAFVDSRRLARIRLIDAAAEEMRKTTPLKENGPDPIVDKDILTVEWLSQKLRSKKVPVKALLLNQANISGIGNWVADEVMYQARLHPEQYSNTFSDEQIKRLHDAIMYVCDTAVELNAEYELIPDDWLMKYRWGKGKKDANTLPNGEKITFLTVGGRTSAVVVSRQKKTAAVAGDVSEGAEDDDTAGVEAKSKSVTKRKAKAVKEEEEDVAEAVTKTKLSVRPRRAQKKVKEEVTDDSLEEEEELVPAKPKRGKKVAAAKKEELDHDAEEVPASKKRKTAATTKTKPSKKTVEAEAKVEDTSARRRSSRVTK
ncbi:hypothetical protein NX059_006685 [Plenodomus lindquistii]|nr:hypothetical protein NX059_006685 [Plenodomus lindquistii]